MITAAQLRLILPFARQRIPEFIEGINATMAEFEIDKTVKRQAAFIAQIGHESGQLRYVKELASGHDYEGRKDLGNLQPGDGVRYKGRGVIQITGKYNYRDCGQALGLDLINHPELLELPINACRSAGWFWSTRSLNGLADAGDLTRLTKRINGGLLGQADRIALYARAMEVLAE